MSVVDRQIGTLHYFFRSVPMPCPYLAGHVERKLFTRLSGADAAALNSLLSQAGFRRSHDIIYRPVCSDCNACVPVRIAVNRFSASRSIRRTMSRNADLVLEERPAVATGEQYVLFHRYQLSRHGDSDMARMTFRDYTAMTEEGGCDTRVFELRRGARQLLGAILADRLSDGYSAVYSFFEPSEARRSLGTQLVLSLVQRARAEGREHVYLGYWVRDSQKMAYKIRFSALEALTAGRWRPFSQTLQSPSGSLR